MKTNISDMVNGTIAPPSFDPIAIIGEWDVKIIREDGRIETKTLRNIVTRYGLNRIANRAVQATGTTPFFVIGVGTQTAAASLDSVQAGLGEVIRKSSAIAGANAQSREWIFMQCTVGGFSDSLTGVVLDSAAIMDHPNSHASTGILANQVNGLAVTLANSDLLDLTVRLRVGSHNFAHTT